MMTGDKALPFRPVKSRLVLFFPGFEPLGPEAHRRRFGHSARKTGPHFGAGFDCGPLQSRSSNIPGFVVKASGRGWETTTDIAVFDWMPILKHYADRPFPVRLFSGFAALLMFFFNGTFFRYLAVSWRYGFFYAYPFALLFACVFGGWIAASLAAFVTDSIAAHWFAGAVTAFLLTALATEKAHLLLMMDDWAFAADLAKRTNPAIEAKRAALQTELAAEIRLSGHDEILAIGHSLGCVFAVDALAAAGLDGGKMPQLMTAGSSLMKIALHPAASWLVSRIGALTTSGVRWLDIQCLTDTISFYNSNPATSAGVSAGLKPKTLAIRFSQMLSPETYRKGKYNFFRTHRQFVLSAERPYPYSMHMIAAGPVPFEQVWEMEGFPYKSDLFGKGLDTGA